MIPFVEWADDPRKGFHIRDDWDPIEGWKKRGILKLFPIQRRILGHCLTPNEVGRLPYTTVVYSCVKKSGKTTVGAAVMGWFGEEGEELSEMYALANDEEQARSRIFSDLKYHMECRELKTLKSLVTFPNETFAQAIAKEYKGAAGSRHVLTTWDELHAYTSERSRRLWEEMTPIPTVKNSLRLVVTYAGYEDESDLLWDLYESGFLEGEVVPELADIVDEMGEPVCRRKGRIFVYWDTVPRMPWQTPEYYCLPLPKDKTRFQVMTDMGPKPAEDVSLGDRLATRDDSGQVHFLSPSALHRFVYSGELYSYSNTKAKFSVTENHKLLAKVRKHTRNPYGEYELIPVKDAIKCQMGMMPRIGGTDAKGIEKFQVEDEVYSGDDFIELLAWFLSEGHVHKTRCNEKAYPVGTFISQSRKVNGPKYERIKNLLIRLGLSDQFKEWEGGLMIYNARLARYMSQFGKAADKFIPDEIKQRASQKQLARFVEAYILGDGTKVGKSMYALYTISDCMKDDLMLVAWKAGYWTSYHGAWSASGNAPVHHMYLSHHGLGWSTAHDEKNPWSVEAVNDIPVWCPETEFGTFYAIVDGDGFWTGNSEQMEGADFRPSAFLRLHRNQWVSSAEEFIPVKFWDKACVLDGPLTYMLDSPYRTFPLSLGIDVGTKHDRLAVAGVYYDAERGKVGQAFHRIWTPPKDAPIDLEDTVEKFVLDMSKEFTISACVYDPTQMVRSAATLKKAGIPMIEFPQTASNMTAASENLFELLKNEAFETYANEEMRDHIRFAKAKVTERGSRLVKGVKGSKRQSKPIDFAIALAMACYDAIQRGGVDTSIPIIIESPFGDASHVRYKTPLQRLEEKMLPPQLRS